MLRTKKAVIYLLASGWVLAQLMVLPRFPTVFIDEAENANHIVNTVLDNASVFTLYDDLYPRQFYAARQGWPVVIRPFFVRAYAWGARIMGSDWVRLRLLSVGIGLLFLGILYRISLPLLGRTGAWTALALAGCYFPFLYSSHSIRPEILLTLVTVSVLAAYMRAEHTRSLVWFGVVGFLTGVAPGVHTNGAALCVPLLILIVQRPQRAMIGIVLGGVAGLTWFVSLADWERFFVGYYSLFMNHFTQLPLLEWFSRPWLIFTAEISRYFSPWIFGHWTHGALFAASLGIQHAVYALLLLWASRQKTPIRTVAWFGIGLALGYALFVGQKAVNYLSVMTPFFALTTSAWLVDPRWYRLPLGAQSQGAEALVKAACTVLGWLAIGMLAVGTLIFQGLVSTYQPSFSELSDRLRQSIKPQSRVAGPQEAWLGLADRDYRDIGALQWHRLLKGDKNLWAPLAQWQPTYLILDQGFMQRLARFSKAPHMPAMKAPTQILPWPHRVLDVLQTGPAYGTVWVLVQVDAYPAGAHE